MYMSEDEKVKFREGSVQGSGEECPHDKLEFLGSQKAEKGANRYYRCLKCGSVIVIPSDEDKMYVIPGIKDVKDMKKLEEAFKKKRNSPH